jgi:hypothetical protein
MYMDTQVYLHSFLNLDLNGDELKNNLFFTHQVGVAVRLETCIWGVLGSNLGRDTPTLQTEVFRDFRQSFQAKPQPHPFFPNSLLINHPTIRRYKVQILTAQ